MMIDRLIDRIKETDNPSVIGLDTCVEYLPDDMQAKCGDNADAAKYITEFNYTLIDALKDIAPAVKVQVAYYEQYGWQGMKAFADTLSYAKEKGMFTIADVKRNDIGSTAAAYSRAYLVKGAPFESDFITVNGYLGTDGIKPFIDDCKAYDKGIFALVKTSNPTSGELQDKTFGGGKTLYEEMGALVEEKWGADLRGKYGYSGVGAVVGATHREQAAVIRGECPHTFFLIPGYGAQGGKAQDLAVCFRDGIGGIVNSSRGILCAYKKAYLGSTYAEGAIKAALDMKKDLTSAIKG